MDRYDIVLHNKEDKEEFLHDMEHPCHKSHIPARECECCAKRPTSKVCTFRVTEEEAKQLQNDDRVKFVNISPWDDKHVIIGPDDKIPVPAIIGPEPPPELGDVSPEERYNLSSYINFNVVDDVNIVVVDSAMYSAHPEFDKITYPPPLNKTRGGSRFKSRALDINWFAYNNILGLPTPSQGYNYEEDRNRIDAYHGTHVGTTIAGNINGWAKNSNIFFMSFYDYNDNISVGDYIRAFHNNGLVRGTLPQYILDEHQDLVPVNGVYNRTKPTIVNNSWGYRYDLRHIPINAIERIVYRNTVFNRPRQGWDLDFFVFTLLMSLDRDVNNNWTLWQIPYRVPSIEVEVQEMVDDGIVHVSSAGNNYQRVVRPGHIDYDNHFIFSSAVENDLPWGIRLDGNRLFFNRGASPGCEPSIVVAATASNDRKAGFSNFGNNIDVFAPGVNICAGVQRAPDVRPYDFETVGYPRYNFNDLSNNWELTKLDGTSMATPQVVGVLALAASNSGVIANPADFDQTAALNWLSGEGSIPAVVDPGPRVPGQPREEYWTAIYDSPNRLLHYPYATSELATAKSNSMAYDNNNQKLFYIESDLRLYYLDVSDLQNMPEPQLVANFVSPVSQPGNASYIFDGNGHQFFYFEFNSNILVRVTLTYDSNGVPSVSSTKKITVNNMSLPATGEVGNNTNTFGDIAINITNGLLYASTSRGRIYRLSVLDRHNFSGQNNTFTEIKASPGNDKTAGFQLAYDAGNNVLYGHNYKTGNWYKINTSNGNLTAISIPSSGKYRDLAGSSNIIYGINENGDLDILNMKFLLPS